MKKFNSINRVFKCLSIKFGYVLYRLKIIYISIFFKFHKILQKLNQAQIDKTKSSITRFSWSKLSTLNCCLAIQSVASGLASAPTFTVNTETSAGTTTSGIAVKGCPWQGSPRPLLLFPSVRTTNTRSVLVGAVSRTESPRTTPEPISVKPPIWLSFIIRVNAS